MSYENLQKLGNPHLMSLIDKFKQGLNSVQKIQNSSPLNANVFYSLIENQLVNLQKFITSYHQSPTKDKVPVIQQKINQIDVLIQELAPGGIHQNTQAYSKYSSAINNIVNNLKK